MCIVVYVFVFKQKTAYEMRISDWSSDVCSSDLDEDLVGAGGRVSELAGDPSCLLGIPAEEFGGIGNFAARIWKRLAIFQCNEHGQFLGMFGHQDRKSVV